MSSAAHVSSGRFRALAALAFGKLRLTPAEKDQLVEQLVPGKTSFHTLTNAEADLVIDELKRRAGQTPTRPQERARRHVRGAVATGDVTTLITPAQRARVAELVRDLIAGGLSAGYIAAVRLRAAGRPEPMTSFEAEKAIEALKALLGRVQGGWRPPEGPA